MEGNTNPIIFLAFFLYVILVLFYIFGFFVLILYTHVQTLKYDLIMGPASVWTNIRKCKTRKCTILILKNEGLE